MLAICLTTMLTLLAELALAGASETLRCTRRKQEQMETNPIIHDLSEYPRKVRLLWNEALLRDLIDVIRRAAAL